MKDTKLINNIIKCKKLLNQAPETKHDYCWFAGQEWMSKEVHEQKLATQQKKLLKEIKKIILVVMGRTH